MYALRVSAAPTPTPRVELITIWLNGQGVATRIYIYAQIHMNTLDMGVYVTVHLHKLAFKIKTIIELQII